MERAGEAAEDASGSEEVRIADNTDSAIGIHASSSSSSSSSGSDAAANATVETTIVAHLKQVIMEKDLQIESLKRTIIERDNEIIKLKRGRKKARI